MGDYQGEKATAARRRATLATLALAAGCSLLVSAASAQSLTDRFKSLFGGGKSEPAEQGTATPSSPDAGVGDLTCPEVTVRPGASTYAVAAPGKQPVGSDLRYQATIGRTARECSVNGGQVTARVGIQGRVIAGPAEAPPTVDVPLRIAVVQEGVSPKTIFTKSYQTSVTMNPDGSTPFTLVVDDVVYPVPPGATGDSYVFYIGFDPQALKPEPKAASKRKK
jgi:hypothetical protein